MSLQVSVIIPFYNSRQHLERCCRSLFSQTLQSMQFVFVDDASTDGSAETVKMILRDFPSRLPQVTIITHRDHQGVGAARQHGLEACTGEYVIHCDSDDYTDDSFYESLYQLAKQTDADIVTAGYIVETTDGKILQRKNALSINSAVEFSIGPQTGSLCLKLIRRSLILRHELHIPVACSWGEDLCFSLETLLLANRVCSLDGPCYHYVQHNHSVTHQLTAQKCDDLVQCGTIIESFLSEHQLLEPYRYQLNWLKFQLKQYYLIFPETRSISDWKMVYPESNRQVSKYPVPIYLKLASWLISHHLPSAAVPVLKLKDQFSRFHRS